MQIVLVSLYVPLTGQCQQSEPSVAGHPGPPYPAKIRGAFSQVHLTLQKEVGGFSQVHLTLQKEVGGFSQANLTLQKEVGGFSQVHLTMQKGIGGF